MMLLKKFLNDDTKKVTKKFHNNGIKTEVRNIHSLFSSQLLNTLLNSLNT